MKKMIDYFLCVMFVSVTLISCQKSEDCDPDDEESFCYAGPINSDYFSMKLDGIVWKGASSRLFFVEHGEITKNTEGMLSLLVNLMGVTPDGKELFLIGLSISPEKLSNPVGVYRINTDAYKLFTPGTADLLQGNSSWPKAYGWRTRIFKEGSPDAGIVTITEFEKGNGEFTKHFIRLKGTFSGTIFEYDPDITGKTKQITDGKFNLMNQLYKK